MKRPQAVSVLKISEDLVDCRVLGSADEKSKVLTRLLIKILYSVAV